MYTAAQRRIITQAIKQASSCSVGGGTCVKQKLEIKGLKHWNLSFLQKVTLVLCYLYQR